MVMETHFGMEILVAVPLAPLLLKQKWTFGMPKLLRSLVLFMLLVLRKIDLSLLVSWKRW
jgi:hypothetical protein